MVDHPIYDRRVTQQSRVRKKNRNQARMSHLVPTAFAFGGKHKAWAKLAGCQICSGKDPPPLVSTPPFLFCWVNHHPSPAKEASTGVEREMVLSQIALGLKLLDAYPRSTASNCLVCLGVQASVNS